jgi:hypothetical protein
MKKNIFGFIFILSMSCSKSNDPTPVYNNPILGRWQLENSGVTVEFDVILVKNPSPPFDPKTDTIFTTNARVTYMDKTGLQPFVGYVNKVNYQNGFYTFSFQTNIGKCPVCAGNFTQLNAFYPNSAFTEMTSQETDPNGINYPYDGSWVSVMAYDGTLNTTNPIFLKEPLVLKRIKG